MTGRSDMPDFWKMDQLRLFLYNNCRRNSDLRGKYKEYRECPQFTPIYFRAVNHARLTQKSPAKGGASINFSITVSQRYHCSRSDALSIRSITAFSCCF